MKVGLFEKIEETGGVFLLPVGEAVPTPDLPGNGPRGKGQTLFPTHSQINSTVLVHGV